MGNRVVKLQVRLFLEGDEEHAIVMSSDIFKTPGLFSSISAPSVDFWVKDAARALIEGRPGYAAQNLPDADLLKNIHIVEPTVDSPAIDIKETDEGAEVVLLNHQNAGPEGEQPIIDLITTENEKPAADEPLDIAVTPLHRIEEQAKKAIHVIIRQEALNKAEEHARADTSRETGGVMLGMFIENETAITVVFTGIVRALSAIRETSSVKFTPETWAEIWQIIDQDKEYSDENLWNIVGWYHTHPDFGVFLSGYDKFIQKEYFTRKGHLALVIDPVRKDRDFFVTDRATGETPCLEKNLVTYVENDDVVLQKIHELQPAFKLTHLPSIEIPSKKEDTAIAEEKVEAYTEDLSMNVSIWVAIHKLFSHIAEPVRNIFHITPQNEQTEKEINNE